MLSCTLNLQTLICNLNHHYNVNLGLSCFTKVNTNYFPAEPVLALIQLVGPSTSTKKLFFRLSV